MLKLQLYTIVLIIYLSFLRVGSLSLWEKKVWKNEIPAFAFERLLPRICVKCLSCLHMTHSFNLPFCAVCCTRSDPTMQYKQINLFWTMHETQCRLLTSFATINRPLLMSCHCVRNEQYINSHKALHLRNWSFGVQISRFSFTGVHNLISF
jgi:hypothetical protein